MARDRDLLVPGVETIGLHADRDIEIEPDAEAELLAKIAAGAQLPVGDPLDIFGEGDGIGLGAVAQHRALLVVRMRPDIRPFPPRPDIVVAQCLEAGKAIEQRPLLGAKRLEVGHILRGIGAPGLKGLTQRCPFDGGDVVIVDTVARLDVGKVVRRGDPRQLRHINIERVEEGAAVRRIGAAIAGPVVEQRMQRIEADPGRVETGGQPQHLLQVGEIADAPVALRRQAVKLDRQDPDALEIPGIGGARRDDQRGVLAQMLCIGEFGPVDADRKRLADLDMRGGRGAAGDGRLVLRDGPRHRQGHACVQGDRHLVALRDLLTLPVLRQHHRPGDEAPSGPYRQRTQDDIKGGGVGPMRLPLPVDEVGLDAEFGRFEIEVHFSRWLSRH